MTTHNIEKTEGVVLKITPSKESDAILSIYTHDYGRISVYGKGIKKSILKMRVVSHLLR